MHLYLMTRGPKHVRDLWVTHMQAQTFWWKRKNLKTGKDEKFLLAGGLKPIELWEYVFPEEYLAEVCYYLKIDPRGQKFQCHAKQLEKIAYFLRKGLRLKPIPSYADKKTLKVSPRILDSITEGFTMYGLGIKHDETKDFPQWGYNQEAI